MTDGAEVEAKTSFRPARYRCPVRYLAPVEYRCPVEYRAEASRRGDRRVLGLSRWCLAAVLVSLLFPVAGCANTCTAIGWFDELEVEVTGDSAGTVDRLEVCFEGSCYSGRASDPEESPQLEVVTVEKTGTGWTVSTSMQTPEIIQLSAYSASGELLAEHEVDLSWKRVGGTARCGGPHEAKTSISVGP